MTRKQWILAATLTSLLALGVAGCSKKEETASQEAAQPAKKAATPIDPATAGSISGAIAFAGAVPKANKIDMGQDPACAAMQKGAVMAETYVVDNGNLANVFVYVKDGLGDRAFDVPAEPVTLDQSGCHYVPHVLGVMAGQTVRILNSDNTTHNIHPTPQANREWNESQAPKAAPLDKTFPREEIMLPVKCNQHPWMKMYLNVVKNPFFAVSAKDGKFELKGLPPGEYTIAAVHEKLGEQTMKVTVGAKEAKTADFSFGEAAAGAGGQQ